MTLVAAFRPEGVPVLVGDFLITGAGTESARKKIYKVGPNFVVGWSGPMFVAAPILKALFTAFEDQRVSLAEVEAFFTDRPPDELSDLPFFVIGWVITDQPYCFLWNILHPTQLFFEPYHVVGSGTQKFEELITRQPMGGSWGKKRNSVEQAVFKALSKATELYSDENLERMNRRDGFGHGYELLYFDGEQFNYVENIAFFGMDILLNPDDDFSGNSQPYEYWYRYHSISNSAFLQIVNLRKSEMTFEIIPPVFNHLGKDDSFDFTAGSFRADYYCIYFRIQTTKGEFYTASLVLAENKDGPSRYEKQHNGKIRFELPNELIKFIYQNMTAEVDHHKTQTIPWGWGSAETEQIMVGAGSGMSMRVMQNDKCVVLGLIGDSDWNKSYGSMDHAIMAAADGTLRIYERGAAVGPFAKHYSANDLLQITVEEINSVPKARYYLNSECLFESSRPITFPLRGAVCLKEEGARVSESKVHGKWIV